MEQTRTSNKALELTTKKKRTKFYLGISDEQWELWNISLREIKLALGDAKQRGELLGITDKIDIFNRACSGNKLGLELFKNSDLDVQTYKGETRLLEIKGLNMEFSLGEKDRQELILRIADQPIQKIQLTRSFNVKYNWIDNITVENSELTLGFVDKVLEISLRAIER